MDLKAELVNICPELATRQMYVWTGNDVREAYFVNYFNLPVEVQSCGAERENNRLMFAVRKLANGKFKLEHNVNALAREYQLRAKTAPLEKLIPYLVQFLQKVMAEVPPKYTHSVFEATPTHTTFPSDNG